MEWIDASSAEAYLRRAGWIAPQARVEISPLAGGVSNEVLYVAALDAGVDDFVLKQARPQLRTADAWHCPTERIWREVDVLRACAGLTRQTPRILHEDRANHVFAMTAAPRGHHVWKADLLAGQFDATIAEACGTLLAALHAGTWRDAELARTLDDRTFFELLRLDPYYRHVARTVPEAAEAFERLCTETLAQRWCLVHADFSPKNLLIWPGGLMLVDFETGHYGDPAFDLGFFLSHLVLKAFHHAPRHAPLERLMSVFLANYETAMRQRIDAATLRALLARSWQHLAGCAWARLDGKSKVEYLADPARRDAVRQVCRELFAGRPAEWDEVHGLLAQRLASV